MAKWVFFVAAAFLLNGCGDSAPQQGAVFPTVSGAVRPPWFEVPATPVTSVPPLSPVRRLDCLDDGTLAAVRERPELVVDVFLTCHDELLPLLPADFTTLSTGQTFAIFLTYLAYSMAPYGPSEAMTLEEMLFADHLNGNNYPLLVAHLFYRYAGGWKQGTQLVSFGIPLFAQYGHTQLLVTDTQTGRGILLDPTVGVVADVDFDGLFSTRFGVPAADLVHLGWREESGGLAAWVTAALQSLSAYRPSTLVYFMQADDYVFGKATGAIFELPTPGAYGAAQGTVWWRPALTELLPASRLACLTDAQVNGVRADPSTVSTLFAGCRAELAQRLPGFSDLSEAEWFVVFLTYLSYSSAPYGDSSASTLAELLTTPTAHCYTYALLVTRLFEKYGGAYKKQVRLSMVGFQGQVIGNHVQLFLRHPSGRGLLLDPTVSLVARARFDGVLSGTPISPSDIAFFPWRWDDDRTYYGNLVVSALTNGFGYRTSDMMYFYESRDLEQGSGSFAGIPLPGAYRVKRAAAK